MQTLHDLFPLLASKMEEHYELADKSYVIPALPQAQCIVIPLLREAIAPILVRNNEADEITDMHLAGALRVRMIASKTKGVERRRGAQILRALGMGGRAAANKAYIPEGMKAGEIFDLNSFIFGDSAKEKGSSIYPVHAAVLYSDAVSLQPKKELVNSVFRQGGVYEDGGNFNAENKTTSANIFTTYAVRPGALFVQSIVATGRRLTRTALDHLLLSVGLAGAYGGATATTGTNLRTHFAGLYWGRCERAINAPQEMLGAMGEQGDLKDMLDSLGAAFSQAYPNGVDRQSLSNYLRDLVEQFERSDKELLARYVEASQMAASLFNAWFYRETAKERRGRKTATQVEVSA